MLAVIHQMVMLNKLENVNIIHIIVEVIHHQLLPMPKIVDFAVGI